MSPGFGDDLIGGDQSVFDKDVTQQIRA